MKHYIDKDALVAEIERLQDAIKATAIDGRISKEQAEAYKVCVKLRSFVEDTIEVKEVDSEKTINDYFKDWKFDEELDIMVKPNNYSATFDDIKDIAKHFFELGLKATQKGECICR